MSKKLPTLSAETLAKYDGCRACAYLQGLSQCNVCRAERPNRQTRTRRELGRLVREQGMTVAEAEAHLGVKAGPTIGG